MKLSTPQWGMVAFIGVSLIAGLSFLVISSVLISQDIYQQAQTLGPSTTGTPFLPDSNLTPEIRQGALIVTPAAGGSNQTKTTPTVREAVALPQANLMFDANFRPDPHGFGFRNYGSRFPEGNITIAESHNLFGDAVCANGTGKNCLPLPAAQLWMDTMNDYMDDGHCAGFTTASRRFFADQLDYSFFAPKASQTFDINQNVPTMRQIAKDWVLQVTEEVWQARVAGTPREVVDRLLDRGEPVDLGIFGRTGGGHSLLAYGVEDKGDGIYWLRVYDNNWPGRDLFVEVDYQANTWRYSLGATNPDDDLEAWEGDNTTKTLMYIPFAVYDQAVTCPFCEGTNGNKAPQFNFIALTGEEALLQVSDESGNRIGHYGDDYVNEIAQARLVRLKDNMYNHREPYIALPPELPFTVQVLPRPGQEIANSTLRAGGAGFTFAVDGLDLASGQVGAISVKPAEGVVVTANGPLNPVLQIALAENGLSTFAIVGNTNLDPNENLNLSLDPDSGELLISNLLDPQASGQAGTSVDSPLDISAEDNTVSLALMIVGQDQEPLIFTHPAIPLPAGGSAALDVANWAGSDSLAIRLDRGGDGLYEEDWMVAGEPIDSLIDQLNTGPEIITLLGNLGPYLNQLQADALLNSLAESGGQCSAANTLTTHKLDGDDIGEVLFAFNRLKLSPSTLANFLNRLDLVPDELAHIIFDLNPSSAEQAALLAALGLTPAKSEALQHEFDRLNAVDAAIDEWEWQNKPFNQLPQFLQAQGFSVSQMGYFLDELNLELVELAGILADLNLADDELATIFYELNLSQPQWNQVLTNLGLEPQFITNLVATGPQQTSFAPVSSWQTAQNNASFCGFTSQPTPTPSPTPTATLLPSPTPIIFPTATPTPIPDDDDDGGPANSPPVLIPDNPTINEDTPTVISPLDNDYDPDDDPLTITGASAGTSGGVTVSNNNNISISANGTKITYSPNLDFAGNDTLNYTVSDGQGNSATTNINITVQNVNDPPVFGTTPTVLTATNTVLYTYVVTATDVDLPYGDVLTITGATQPGWLTVTPIGNGTANLSGTPGVTDAGVHAITLQVQDSAGVTLTQQFNITVELVLVVDTTSDAVLNTCSTAANDCSLRGAIGLANTNTSIVDTIKFDIPGAGPHTINVGSALPPITDPVILDGTTEPDASCTAWPPSLAVVLNGGGGAYHGLNISAGSSTVKGLVIQNFGNNGLDLNTTGSNIIQCNFIGTDVSGNIDVGNTLDGLQIFHGANNIVGGTAATDRNLISGNDDEGLQIADGATGTIVQGNYIGTNVNGTAALGNGVDGIDTDINVAGTLIGGTTNVTVGGPCTGACNLISGNTHDGITLFNSPGAGNTVAGNFIGTDVTGKIDLGNGDQGISIGGSANNTIGGTSPQARNLISGNNKDGIDISGAASTGNKIQGNYIGTNISGTAPITNGASGILIETTATNNIIGGTIGVTSGGPCTGVCNLISGNGNRGILIKDVGTNGTTIQGNYIGTTANGSGALGNVFAGVQNMNAVTTVGGTTAAAGNLIAHNHRGIRNQGSKGVLTASFNTIFSNNPATFDGGGIDNINNGVLTVTNSTLSGNSAVNGGGIDNAGTIYIINSTLSGNTATANGGGIRNTGGTAYVINSTLSGNTATANGGGIHNNNATTYITNTTITNNSSPVGDGVYHNSGTITIRNTLIANNIGPATTECAGPALFLTDRGFNWVEDGSCTSTAYGDPNLAVLADNGGPTKTHKPLLPPGVIDQGHCSGYTTDQRGSTRPIDDPGGVPVVNPPAGDGCDIGAVEVQ